jgi:hypothetical protein
MAGRDQQAFRSDRIEKLAAGRLAADGTLLRSIVLIGILGLENTSSPYHHHGTMRLSHESIEDRRARLV